MTQLVEWVQDWEAIHPGGSQIHRVPLHDAFSLAMRLESRAAAMYREFARQLGQDDPEIAGHWLELASDEEEHWRALSLAQSFTAGEDTVSILIDRAALLQLATILDTALDEVHSPAFTSRRALKLAWAVESSEMDYLMELLTELPEHVEVRDRLWHIKVRTGYHREKLEEISMLTLGPQAPISEW